MALTPPNLPFPGKSRPRSSKTQLVVMAFLLLVVASLFGWLRLTEKPVHEEVPIDTSVAPLEAENAPPGAQIDVELLKEVKDATEAERVVREPEPFLHVLMEAGKLVPGDFRRLKAPYADDALYQSILEQPAAWRGKALIAKARFNFATEEKVPLGSGSGPEGSTEFRYWRGVATDDLGRAWSFSLLEPPDAIAPGEVIKIEGFFFKKLALFDPADPAQLIDPTLHLIGKRVVKSFLRMPPVRELSTAVLQSVRDYSIEDRLEIPEEALWHVLSYVQNSDADALAAAAEEGTVSDSEARYLTNQALQSDPDQFRGAPVRLLGSVSAEQKPWFKDDENPLDLPLLWHSLLVHNGPKFTYLISTEKPPEWVSGQATVIVEGVFLKLYTYQAVNRQTVTCPLVVVKRFVPFRIATEELRSGFSWALIAISVPFVLLLLFLATRDRKAAETLRAAQLERRRARRAGAPTAPAVPTAAATRSDPATPEGTAGGAASG